MTLDQIATMRSWEGVEAEDARTERPRSIANDARKGAANCPHVDVFGNMHAEILRVGLAPRKCQVLAGA
jgi:hypothetical protein